MKRLVARVCLKCIPFVVVFLIIVEFAVTNHLAGLGGNVGAIDQNIFRLTEENERIRQQVASASALMTVSKKAEELGFVEPTNVLTIGREQSSVAIVPHR